MQRRMATLAGMAAILLWSALAAFTAELAAIPPFQLLGLSFSVAFLASLAVLLRGGWRQVVSSWRQPRGAWILGVGGLFGYHLFYFIALGNAPPAEASLIAYLWPLLIVLFSALLPGERLYLRHVVAALVALSGTALLIARQGDIGLQGGYWLGYGAALACAFTWSGYTVLNRRFAAVPTAAVNGFCAATALLGFLFHWGFESWTDPSPRQWLFILALGLGPVGAAFFLWDAGSKRGHIQLLGVLSYGAPLLSTLLLVVLGRTQADAVLFLACALIVGAAVIASLPPLRPALWRRRS